MTYTLSKIKIFVACFIMIMCALIIRTAGSYPYAVDVFGATAFAEKQKNITLSDLAENIFCHITDENVG